MSSDEIPPLPPDVGSLLAGARTLAAPGDDVRQRMRARLMAALPPTPDGGGGGGGGGGLSRVSSWGRAPWWAVAAALAAGFGLGRTTPSSLFGAPGPTARSESAQPQAAVERATAVASSMPNTLPVIDPFVDHEPTSASGLRPSSSANPLPTPAGSTGTLAAERKLLEVARTALGRGNGVDALTAADAHASKFPHGSLAEEREAIAVEALAECKRFDDAKQRGERFRRSYPQSILLPAVQAAMEER